MAKPPHNSVNGGILPGFRGKTIIRSQEVHDPMVSDDSVSSCWAVWARSSVAPLACLPGLWYTPPREEGHGMDERQKESWSVVLLTAMVVGLLLGGLLVLRLT